MFLAIAPTIGKGQKAKKPTVAKSILFAVLDDGTEVEPIAFMANGKLIAPEEGKPDPFEGNTLKPYFTPNKTYTFVFGGSADGIVKVVKQFTGECSGLAAQVISSPLKAKPKGFVMALATNAVVRLKGGSIRRMPTLVERVNIDALVREEFIKQKILTDALKKIDYHNLTAIDVDRDGNMEMVGSFWVSPKSDERATLFFIAEKDNKGVYRFAYSEYEHYTKDRVMSEDVKDLDEGVYHTLLLDYFDINGDGIGEVFTTTQAFEGRNFDVYKRSNGKWVNSMTAYNYRCGY